MATDKGEKSGAAKKSNEGEAARASRTLSELALGTAQSGASLKRLASLGSFAAPMPPTPSATKYTINEYLEAANNARAVYSQGQTAMHELARNLASRESLKKEISELQTEVSEKANALEKAKSSGAELQAKLKEFEALIEQLKKKEDLGFLLTRVNEHAQARLIEDEGFREKFAEDQTCNAFVMSVDIRRSTELMLKARTPSMFADFISQLTSDLYRCVVENNGVFDKFTGDGVLAFFPENFSGSDFAYSVVKAAAECHRSFERIYRESRGSFSSVLKGIGLGIGVDYGPVRLLRVAEGLTVVGTPVVYACRLSGAPAGRTLLNQPAFEMVSAEHGKACRIQETSIEIKHEGEVVTYDVSLNDAQFIPRKPDWC